jgi:hypothetical protein
MRPAALLLLLMSMASFSFGQIRAIEQGNLTGGGRMGLNFYSSGVEVLDPPAGFTQSEPSRYFEFYMGPFAAYFLLNGLALGLDTELGISAFSGSSNAYFGVGPLLYYFAALNTHLAIMAKGSFFLYHQSSHNSYSYAIGPGLAWFINANLALTALILLQNEWYTVPYLVGLDLYDARYHTMCTGLNIGFKKFFDLGGGIER